MAYDMAIPMMSFTLIAVREGPLQRSDKYPYFNIYIGKKAILIRRA
jgi:hypothetical protein